jgi:predicted Zn-dependent protease
MPFAIDSLVGFVHNGGTADEIRAAVDTMPMFGDWLGDWIRAQQSIAAKDYPTAAHCLRNVLARNTTAPNNVRVIVELGRVYQLAGKSAEALIQLQRAHSLDPNAMNGMDILAAILCQVCIIV